MARDVSKELKEEIFVLTFTVHRWDYVFDRHSRWDILTDSLKYCRSNKGLKIYHTSYYVETYAPDRRKQ